MSTLNFSNALTNNGLLTQGVSYVVDGLDSSTCRFYLMQGTIPTQGELDVGSANFRSSDRIVYKNSNLTTLTTTSGKITTLGFHEATASQSATATWFYWDGDPASSSGAITRLVGSVTNNGGGGDLTMASNVITIGQVVGIGPVSLEMPQAYTY